MANIIEGQLILPDGIRHGQLVLAGDTIVSVHTERKSFGTPDVVVDESRFISPGLVDIQINGGFGREFKTDADALDVVSARIVQFGVTAICPTITTMDLAGYATQPRQLLARCGADRRARFLGFHFEGPAFNPGKAGAHNPALFQSPRNIGLDTYISDQVRLVTLAPELEGAGVLIAELLKRKIKVGIGHSLVTYAGLMEVLAPEQMIAVHLYNAMEPLGAREPGLVGAGLANDALAVSLIVDGVHVHPSVVKITWRAKHDRRKFICISDGSAVMGLDDGVYQVGSRTIVKHADRAALRDGTLAGSVVPLNVAVRNLQAYTGCTLWEAIATASLNPATFLGRQNEIGQLKPGCKADVLVIDSSLNIHTAWVGGEVAYERCSRSEC